ncbi:MAG: beta-CASP ribonuclease aCPSF1 [Candidatus Aenigmarchaeota archaeon]|nr:beta-CASP ribonuclease aCPSF1 [Candidatus Aenigmarchaeota archaeon]
MCLVNIIDEVKAGLPADADVSDIAFEGSEIVVYVKNADTFLANGSFIKPLVSKLKKRIEIRPDPSITKDMEEVRETIKKLMPEAAGLAEITFEPAFSRVTIEALKPGLVIGKGGETLRAVREQTLWAPIVKRAPVIPSDVVATIRKVLFKESEFRRKFLNDIGKRIHTADKKEISWVRLTSMGAFREVGRSCMQVSTPNSRVMMDCGIKPSAKPEYPYLQVPEFNMKALDAVIISHSHLDHVGFMPYLYEYGYEGPLYCTAPTRDLMTLLCLDYMDIAEREGGGSPYTSKAIEKAIKHSITLEYNEVSDIAPDVRLTFQNAGHIMGSALTHLHIGDGLHNIVYTGDYNFERSRLLEPAYSDFQRVETLITESTYGAADAIQPPRSDAERKLAEKILETMLRGGKVLIPSFAVERAQEVMAVIAGVRDFKNTCYLDGMLWDATAIHTTYPEYMSRDMQYKIFSKGENPFVSSIFKRVGSGTERKEVINSADPFVVIATSGMLMGGPAVEYLKNFADNPKNMLLFVGYQAEGTLGAKIQRGWKEIPLDEKGKRTLLKINMEVVSIDGFSGHSDRNQLMSYVHRLRGRPQRVICVHGEESRCLDLARSIHKAFKIETIVPRNMETIRLV